MGSQGENALGTAGLDETRVSSIHDAEETAYKESAKLGVDKIAGHLLGTLGQRVTAVGVGVKDVRPVREWLQGNPVRLENERRLRLLYRVSRTIELIYGEATARAFLRSSSPYLDDEAPLIVIGAGSHEREADVIEALRAFMES